MRQQLRAELEAPAELRKFGNGWIAGTIALAISLAALIMVLVLRQPSLLGVPELSPLRESSWMRPIVYAAMFAAYALACISLVLRPNKLLGTLAIVITLIAAIWAYLPQIGDLSGGHKIFFGIDFFVINLIFGSVLFLPLERMFAKVEDQPVFRTEWREDLFYFFLSSMFVQFLSFAALAPSNYINGTGVLKDVQIWVGGLNFFVQLICIMVLTDFVQYWFHRAFHRIPALWRFHAVHHSAQKMDWIAGTRMHFVEIMLLRAFTATPAFVLGFSQSALQTYLLIIYIYSTFVHANLNWKLGFMEKFLVTPRFHHWHHGLEKEAIDVNFAIHFPLYDKLFGTYHMPETRWPSGYGIGGHPVPKGYWKQFLYPFQREA
jgi:sterol desaturase/sphingolipid hydroxylase (fatty acid hydroxylase superfamily)